MNSNYKELEIFQDEKTKFIQEYLSRIFDQLKEQSRNRYSS